MSIRHVVKTVAVSSAATLCGAALALGLGALFALLPVVWIAVTAFQPLADAFQSPPIIFFRPTLANFAALYSGQDAVVDPPEGIDDLGVEVAARLLLDHRARLLEAERDPIRAVGGERVEHVGDGEHARVQRNLLAGETVGIAVPVPSLVMGAHDLGGFGEELDVTHDLGSDDRVA